MQEEDARKMVLELRSIQARAEEAQRQLAALQAFASESAAARTTLENLGQAYNEALFPIGAGVFIKGRASDAQRVLVDIGAGVIAEKTVSDAVKALEERAGQLARASQRIQSDLQALLQRSDELNSRLAELAQGK